MKFLKVFASYLVLLGLFTLVFGAIGCSNPVKKQARKETRLLGKLYKRMDKAEAKYETASVVDSGVIWWITNRHPIKIGRGKPTITPGKKVTVTVHDTTYTMKRDTVIKTVTITKHTHSTDTLEVPITIVDSNSIKQVVARNKGLQLEASAAKEGENKAKAGEASALKWGWRLGGLALVLLVALIVAVIAWLKK